MRVLIELEFDNEPTRYDIYNYILELMQDQSLSYRVKLKEIEEGDK